MDDSPFPVVTVEYMDDFGELIGDPSVDVELAISQIPTLFGTSDMATFLAYRALGLGSRQAFQIMGRDESLLAYWREEYPDFLQWEFKHLPAIQKHAGKLLVRQAMMRNLMIALNLDHRILAKTLDPDGMETMTNRENRYLMAIRPKYTTTDLLAIERMISPEDYRGDVVVNMTWDTREQKVEIHNTVLPELSPGNSSPD